MTADTGSLVNAAIRDALREGADAYEAQGVMLLPNLEAQAGAREQRDAPLYQALYTIFRGLADRLAPGATLFISTRDLPDETVELVWEAREKAHGKGSPDAKHAFRSGPHGDLLELAIAGLERFCRIESKYVEEAEDEAPPSVTFLTLSPRVRRRYRFLIPPSATQRENAP